MSLELTERQVQILELLKCRAAEQAPMPSFREIGQHIGTRWPNAVAKHLRALQKKGKIVKRAGAIVLADVA